MKPISVLRLSTTLLLLLSVLVTLSQTKKPVDYVDPFIGTDFFGHTFPGSSLPYSMIHLSPDVNTKGWTSCAGYYYSENSIMGFSHTHWSGVGMVDGGEILLMPTVGNKIQIQPGTLENPDLGYRSRFDHENETASPGYYSVLLTDYNVWAEITTTKRVGFHRYTFPESLNSRIILDLGHQIGDAAKKGSSEITIRSNTLIEGKKTSSLGNVYFVADFSKPFQYYGTFDATYFTPESGGSIFPYKNAEKGIDIGTFVTYQTSEDEQILVKVGISFVSIEGARKNLNEEIPHWDFDKVKTDATEIWNKELSKIIIEETAEDKKQIFYTSMYHSLLATYISQDVDGNYFGMDGKIHRAKNYDFYSSFSCWDTYRSQQPLLTLITPNHVNDMIKSITAKTENFGWLPAQHFQNNFRESMVGDHLIPIITDAYIKGFRDYDINLLYEAMRKKALENPMSPIPKNAGRSGLNYYKEIGFTPIDKVTEAVPNTLEMAYDDWCIAQLAKDLGKEHDFELFAKRANNYKNLWDENTQFMRPKKSDGSWLPELYKSEQKIVKDGDHSYYKYFDPLLVGRRPNRHYTESNAWQYIWSVQHDINGLINLFGGDKQFVNKLDTFFEMSPVITPPKYVGVVGTIGQYVHGNQPSHHVSYLYNYVGQPWKTQKRVRQIMEEMYRTGPGGLCGNEDMGSLSSWYVLSALGFYPVTPGSPNYVIGSPLIGKASIKISNESTFVIEAKNNSKNNVFIQSVSLNGKPLTKTWLSHSEITKGGLLVFEMGSEPNKKWGNSKTDAPPSMSN